RLNAPAFVADRANQSAAFLEYGLWRLQLMSSLSGLRPDFLQDFLTELMRTLISGGKQKLLTVHTDTEVYDPSESIDFNALLVGQNGAPIDDAAVDLAIMDQQGRAAAAVRLTPTGEGGYTGSISGLGQGRYTYAPHASSGSTF
ncbi:MAG: hypothetical protein M1339_00190, partial [Bacteroidetes bacterium]|nr:hypothetical protein [Bacteroidota bacterium]